MLIDAFPKLEVFAEKNKETIICEAFITLVAILWLERDPDVRSYFQPKMDVCVTCRGVGYKFEIDLWVEFNNGEVWCINFVNPDTQKLFRRKPDILEMVKSNCKSFNARYVAMCPSEENGFSLDIVMGNR